jgi:ATP-dependent DNA helicase RecG
VQTSDETGDLTLVWFNAHRSRIEQMCPVGETRIVSGRIELFDGMRQMVHPDRVVTVEQAATMPLLEPIYPLTEGLASGFVRRAAETALQRVPRLPEWLDARLLERGNPSRHPRPSEARGRGSSLTREPICSAAELDPLRSAFGLAGDDRTEVIRGWPDFAASLRSVHAPASPEDFAPEGPAWSRLAYDELLANQLALGLVRANLKRPAGRRNVGDGSLRRLI